MPNGLKQDSGRVRSGITSTSENREIFIHIKRDPFLLECIEAAPQLVVICNNKGVNKMFFTKVVN